MKPSSETIPPPLKNRALTLLWDSHHFKETLTFLLPLLLFSTSLHLFMTHLLTLVYNLAPFFSPVLLSIFSYLVRSLFAFHLPSPSMKRDINQYNHRSPGVKEFVDVLEAFF